MVEDEHLLHDLDENHAGAIANRADKGPTVFSRAADAIRSLTRKAELRRLVIEHAARDAQWLSNASYSVDHGEEADAVKTLIERQAERSVTFNEGAKVRAIVADKMAAAVTHEVWRHVPEIAEKSEFCRDFV